MTGTHSSRKTAAAETAAILFFLLLLAEGLAVGALIHCRVAFVSAHQDAVQGAEVLSVAVICAGLNGAFDALVCIGVHIRSLLIFEIAVIMACKCKNMRRFSFAAIDFFRIAMYNICENPKTETSFERKEIAMIYSSEVQHMCSVAKGAYHCDTENYCSLDRILVGTHEANPAMDQCTDCKSFRKR